MKRFQIKLIWDKNVKCLLISGIALVARLFWGRGTWHLTSLHSIWKNWLKSPHWEAPIWQTFCYSSNETIRQPPPNFGRLFLLTRHWPGCCWTDPLTTKSFPPYIDGLDIYKPFPHLPPPSPPISPPTPTSSGPVRLAGGHVPPGRIWRGGGVFWRDCGGISAGITTPTPPHHRNQLQKIRKYCTTV